MTTFITVPDASCAHCKGTIEEAVTGIEGVGLAELDLTTKRLTVDHDDTVAPSILRSKISEIGYTPED
jgi:Cu2+-exporting ATPase